MCVLQVTFVFFWKRKKRCEKRKFNKQENVLKIELRSSTTLRSVWLKSHRQIAEHHFWADLQNFQIIKIIIIKRWVSFETEVSSIVIIIKIISITKCSPKSNNRIKPNSQNSPGINNAPTSWKSGMTHSLSRLNSHLLTTLTHTLTSAIDITIHSGLSWP